ncbi:hypothetical protein CRG98_044516, partial [Punica granatum]
MVSERVMLPHAYARMRMDSHYARPSMSECNQSVRLVLVPPCPSTEEEPGLRSIVEGGCLRARDNVWPKGKLITYLLCIMSGDQTLAPLAGSGGNEPQLAALLSPYTVTSSDGTGVQLNGDNYLTWSRLMRISLRAKNKLGFIDGTLREPVEGEPNRALWVKANST